MRLEGENIHAETQEESDLLVIMGRAFEAQKENVDTPVVIYLNAPVSSLPMRFKGLIFGVDERGVQGWNLSASHKRGFWCDWVAMDIAATVAANKEK